MAKTRLNEVEKTYIEAKRNQKTVKQIAKTLGVTEKMVQNYLDKHPDTVPDLKIITFDEVKPPKAADHLLGQKTAEKGDGGTVVMNKEASQLADEWRKNRTKKNGGGRSNHCITKARK